MIRKIMFSLITLFTLTSSTVFAMKKSEIPALELLSFNYLIVKSGEGTIASLIVRGNFTSALYIIDEHLSILKAVEDCKYVTCSEEEKEEIKTLRDRLQWQKQEIKNRGKQTETRKLI